MKIPTHRLKKFVRYDGEEKPASSYVTDYSGWLASGIKDKNGVEIFEGDIVKVNDYYDDPVEVIFSEGVFWLGDSLNLLYNFSDDEFEIVGHVEEGSDNG